MVVTTGFRVLIVGAVTPLGFKPGLLAAIVVGTVAIPMVTISADYDSFATPAAEEYPIAIAFCRQSTPRGGWTLFAVWAIMSLAIRHTAMSQRARGYEPRALTFAVTRLSGN
jgi:hypothetical protein